ncbi:MAG: nucleotidyltransferase family protein [Saprospiraceae bacterium]
MKALILAAGLGTRLRPLTDHIPKALIPVNGVTLLERSIRHVAQSGVREILVNVHYFADQVETFLQHIELPDVKIYIQDEREILLDTGGSMRLARDFFGKTGQALVVNADIISTLDFGEMLAFHESNDAAATLDVRLRSSSRQLLFDDKNQLRGWANNKGEFKWVNGPIDTYNQFAFSGIQIIDSAAFDQMPDQFVFSSIDWYLTLAQKHKVLAYQSSSSIWLDVGSAEKLAIAEEIVSKLEQNSER